jgi:phosphomannomutase
MAETGAIFGGEHSGHFYFADFWKADSGMLAAMHALAALGETDEAQTLSGLLQQYQLYVESGEINSTVENAPAIVQSLKDKYSADSSVSIDEMDGLTVSGDTWWFNVRASNTEPLLRLNAEAKTADRVKELTDSVLAVIRA